MEVAQIPVATGKNLGGEVQGLSPDLYGVGAEVGVERAVNLPNLVDKFISDWVK